MDVDAAEAIGMTEYRNACVVFDVADEFVGTPRNDQIDVLVKFKQRGYYVTGGE